jgi:hypothetical protein
LFTENINLFLERRKDTKTIGEKWEKPKKKKGREKGAKGGGKKKTPSILPQKAARSCGKPHKGSGNFSTRE